MKLHFDSNQEYQWDAIKSITDIFEGQPLSTGDFEFSMEETGPPLSLDLSPKHRKLAVVLSLQLRTS